MRTINQSTTRPKSVPNSPSIPRAFSNLRHQLTSAWSSSSKKKQQSAAANATTATSQLTTMDKKKWPSTQDCTTTKSKNSGKRSFRGHRGHRGGHAATPTEVDDDLDNPSNMPKLSVCADSQKVDRTKLAQTEVSTYLHTYSL